MTIQKGDDDLPAKSHQPHGLKSLNHRSTSHERQHWIRVHPPDILLMRNIFREIDKGSNHGISLNQFMSAMEHRGPSTDPLKVRFQRFFQNELLEKSIGLTLAEVLRMCYPKAPTTQISDIVRRVAPTFGGHDNLDSMVQADLKSIGAPSLIAGETKQQRRLRLAVLRSSQTKVETEMNRYGTPLLQGRKSESIKKAQIVVRKPTVRVVFQKRSEQAKRLMEYCNVKKNLLTMDGLPLHAHPSLQLGINSENIGEDYGDDDMSISLSPTGSVGSNQRFSIVSPHERPPHSPHERDQQSPTLSPMSSPFPSHIEPTAHHMGVERGRKVGAVKHKIGSDSPAGQRSPHRPRSRSNRSPNGSRSRSPFRQRHGASSHDVISVYANLFRKSNISESERQQLMTFAEKQDIHGIASLFDSFSKRKLRLDSHTLNLIMKTGLACERPDLTVRFFAAATKEEQDASGTKQQMCIEPDINCLHNLIEAHGRMGNLFSAFNVKGQLEGKKLTPNADTYNAWIRASILNDNMKMAEQYLQEMDQKSLTEHLSRDIRFALEFAAESSLCVIEKTEKQAVLAPSSPQVKYKKLAQVKVGEKAELAKHARELSREIESMEEERTELVERIENLQTTLQILEESERNLSDEQSHTQLVREKLISMQNRLSELEEKILESKTKLKEKMTERVRNTQAVKEDLEETNLDSDKPEAQEVRTPPRFPTLGNTFRETRTKFVFSSKLDHRLPSADAKSQTPAQAAIITKDIFAAPKDYSSGEFTIVASLMLNMPVKSHRNDRVTIQIKNLKDLLNRDCDFLPVYGTGGRICVNGGAKWKRSPGCLRFDIADESIIPSDSPITFRFALNVDIETNHPSVIPTIEIFNSSGSLAIPATEMNGKILEYSASSTKQRLRKDKVNVPEHIQREHGTGAASSKKLRLTSSHETRNFVDWGCDLGSGITRKNEYCFDQGFINSWRPKTVKVYFCANVNDMSHERRHLSEKILAPLKIMCQKDYVFLVWVDLRAGMVSDEYKHSWTLKVMLDEASRCHYFVGMIGREYGCHQPVQIPMDTYAAALKGAKVLPYTESTDDINPNDKEESDILAENEQDSVDTFDRHDSELPRYLDGDDTTSDTIKTGIPRSQKVLNHPDTSGQRRGSKAGTSPVNIKGRLATIQPSTVPARIIKGRRSSPSEDQRRGSATFGRSSPNAKSVSIGTSRDGTANESKGRLSESPNLRAVEFSLERTPSFALQKQRSVRAMSPDRSRGRAASPDRAGYRLMKPEAVRTASRTSHRYASPMERRSLRRTPSMKQRKPSSAASDNFEELDEEEMPYNSIFFEDVPSVVNDVMLPRFADVDFFLNQVHAIKFGHPWINEQLECGLIELEILNRLRSNTTSRHRCLICIRSNDLDTKPLSDDAGFSTDLPKKKLLNLKKRLTSGELGNLEVIEYREPISGAERLGRSLEALIRTDWLSLGSKLLLSKSFRLVEMDDFHKAFASMCMANTISLNAELETTLLSWLSFQSDSGPFIIHGPPGCGRSAFLAKLWRQQLDNTTWNASVIHFAEVDSSGYHAILRFCSAFDGGISNNTFIPGKFVGICELFVSLQAEASETIASRAKRTLLIIDGVDDLTDEGGIRVDLCEYLPSKISANVKIVLSLNSEQDSMGWAETHQWALNELRPLAKSDKDKLVSEYLKSSRRNLSYVERLASQSGKKTFHMRSLGLVLYGISGFEDLCNIDEITASSNHTQAFWYDVMRFSEKIHGNAIVTVLLVSLSLCRDGISRHEIVELLHFARSGFPGRAEADVRDEFSDISLLRVSEVFWPLQVLNCMWDRGDLVNIRHYLKPLIGSHYSLDGERKDLWHGFLADFFARPSTNPARAVREYPYHMMCANKKSDLKRFLLNPQWNMAMISHRQCNDLFNYWRWIGKTSLAESYLNVFWKSPCWGCQVKSVARAAWVHDYIQRGLEQGLEDLKIAEGLEQEIVRKAGKKLWSQQEIVDHLRFHMSAGHATEKMSAAFDLQSVQKLFRTTSGAEDFEFVLNWDDSTSVQWLRMVSYVLFDGIERIGKYSTNRIKEGKRGSISDDIKTVTTHEIAVIRALGGVMLQQNMEHLKTEGVSMSERSIGVHDREIAVQSARDLGITNMANLPATLTVGEEVMTVTKVDGNMLTVVRHGHKVPHQCANLIKFSVVVKFSNFALLSDSDPDQIRLEPQQFLHRFLTSLLELKPHQLEFLNFPSREASEAFRGQERNTEVECCVTFAEFENVAPIAITIGETLMQSYESEMIRGDWIVKLLTAPVHHINRPRIFAQALVPNRMLAVDYFWCAFVAYVMNHKDDCSKKLSRAICILETVCPSPLDHLLIQCKVFLWLLIVEKGRKRAAREKAQEFKSLNQLFNHSAEDNASYIQDVGIERALPFTKKLLDTVKEADELMMGDVKILFDEKVGQVRKMISPCSLLDFEASIFLPPKELWLIVHVEEARDLLAMDLSGTSDPFCTVSVGGLVKKTGVHQKTLNATFKEELQFPFIKPDPDLQVLLDVWDWDGAGRQDLIGFAQIGLKAALEKEGEISVFALNRMQKGKGVQADGIKLGKNVMCGYLSVRFEFSYTLRQTLMTSRGSQSIQETPVTHSVSNSTVDEVNARWISAVHSATWDETVPISTSDKPSWMARFNFLAKMSDEEESVKKIAVEAVQAYFDACNIWKVVPQILVLEFVEAFITGKNGNRVPPLYLRCMEEENIASSVMAAMIIVEKLPCRVLEVGKCKVNGRAASQIVTAVSIQKHVESLSLQENIIGADEEGVRAVSSLFTSSSTAHLTQISISHNKLTDPDVAKFFCDLCSNVTLTSLDVSHNNARRLSATALGRMLRCNYTLTHLDCSWNQLGHDSLWQSNANSTSHPLEPAPDLNFASTAQINSGWKSREGVLRNDDDGRWARHFFKKKTNCGPSILRTYSLFGLRQEAEAFLSAFDQYMKTAEHIKVLQNSIQQTALQQSEMQTRHVPAAQAKASEIPSSVSHVQHGSSVGLARQLTKFRVAREAVFASRDGLIRAIDDPSIEAEIHSALLESVQIHPLFFEKKQPPSCVEGVIIFSALRSNKCLQSLNLGGNSLGCKHSMELCGSIASLASSEECRLQVLNVGYNRISTPDNPSQVGKLLGEVISSNEESCLSLRKLVLDGNDFGESSCRFLMKCVASNPTVSVSLRGCCEQMVHPMQFIASRPYGKYSLEMDRAGSNLLRSIISLICRKLGKFARNQVKHIMHGVAREICIPLTEYMRWEQWEVPREGVVTFEFSPLQDDLSHLVMPTAEFDQALLGGLRRQQATAARSRLLEEIPDMRYYLSGGQAVELGRALRDYPERCKFRLLSWHLTLDPSGQVYTSMPPV